MELHIAAEKECKALEKKYRYLDYEDMNRTFTFTVTLFVTTNYLKKLIWSNCNKTDLELKTKQVLNTFLSFENV